MQLESAAVGRGQCRQRDAPVLVVDALDGGRGERSELTATTYAPSSCTGRAKLTSTTVRALTGSSPSQPAGGRAGAVSAVVQPPGVHCWTSPSLALDRALAPLAVATTCGVLWASALAGANSATAAAISAAARNYASWYSPKTSRMTPQTSPIVAFAASASRIG